MVQEIANPSYLPTPRSLRTACLTWVVLVLAAIAATRVQAEAGQTQLLGQANAPLLQGGEVRLAWDPNPERNLGGYVLHYGSNPGDYTVELDVGKATNVTVSLPIPGQMYYFALTAYTTDNHVSTFSDEVSTQVPLGTNVLSRRTLELSVVEDGEVFLDWDGATPVVEGQWILAQAPAHGEVFLPVDRLSYLPDGDYFGEDTLRVLVIQVPGEILEITAHIQVRPMPDPPYTFDEAYTVTTGQSVFFNLEGEDPDGDAITYRMEKPPEHGKLTGRLPFFTYTPVAGFVGRDELWFLVSDGTFESGRGVISFEVVPVNQPPVAPSFSTNCPQNLPLTLTLTGQDPEGKAVTFEVLALPQHGVLDGTPPRVVYTPDFNYQGADVFRYSVTDLEGLATVCTVSLDVVGTNHPPVTYPQDYQVLQGQAESILLEATDPDGDPLTFRIVTEPQHGTLTLALPRVVYRSDPEFSGRDTFRYVVSDGRSETSPAEVILDVRVSAVPTPSLVAQRAAAGQIDLSWVAKAGAGYQVWRSSTLNATNWESVGDVRIAPADGPMTLLIQPGAGDEAWFYQVVAQPVTAP